jgi:nitrogen fixation protein
MSVVVYQSRFDVPRPPTLPVPQGWEWGPQPEPLKQPRFAAAAMVATGLSLILPAPNAAAARQPLGFEPAPQALAQYGPRESAPAGLVAATGLSLVPAAPPVNAAPAGWSVNVPELPAFRRYQALPELSGRIDPAPVVAAAQPPAGWSVALPELPQFKRVIGALAGADLPAQRILAAAPSGWTIVLHELPAFRRYQALPELSLRLDPAGQFQPYGWSVCVPELPQPRLAPAAMAAAGATLVPQVVLRPLATGWSVALPELPAFRRYQALPELSGRLDPPPPLAGPAVIWGWPELPATPRGRAGGNAAAVFDPLWISPGLTPLTGPACAAASDAALYAASLGAANFAAAPGDVALFAVNTSEIGCAVKGGGCA